MNYTYLSLGDSNLPTVGILQKLLNRAGAKLNPDGVPLAPRPWQQ